MKNRDIDEPPLQQIERSPLLIWTSLAGAGLICWLAFNLLLSMNPWGFLLMVPAIFLSFHALWLVLNPFAIFFRNRVEIRQTLFHNSQRYFVDIKRVGESRQGRLFIVYNDDEVEVIGLFGIRRSQERPLRQLLRDQVELSLSLR